MSATSKHLPKDASNLPVNSHYNETADEHQVTVGSDGAPRSRTAEGDNTALGSRSDAPSSGDLANMFSLIALTKELVHLGRNA